ncbi:polymer-forming cytoskeletal protein [Patescibacteria group bacterium]|nr:polymer-forming cytoskeletal protein [Patescibacteria group bacterium]MBU4453376.1 polymer-forming cytoskeletal protein [Patescibacteria group bacterium]MCG2687697.1 polymer-forming cytoskeletal protein [Candidatus Parcubacteria bacterium]
MAKNQGSETIIAHGVRVEGDFVSDGDVVIEGEVAGTIQAAGDLKIGELAKIGANVIARSAIVAGEIRGNIQVAEKLELLSSARMIGDVTAMVLSVSSGAQVNGKITMDGREVKIKKEKEENGEE